MPDRSNRVPCAAAHQSDTYSERRLTLQWSEQSPIAATPAPTASFTDGPCGVCAAGSRLAEFVLSGAASAPVLEILVQNGSGESQFEAAVEERLSGVCI